jgi:restriction system protein
MANLIEQDSPLTWRELEAAVARILGECGYEVEMQKNVELAGRGNVNIDVWADERTSPPNVIAVECKNWATPATRHEVHAFRTVVGDSGANTGLLVSSAGFQRGAIAAAAYSNVRLLDWIEFQEMFAVRWFRNYFSPRLAEETDPLHEYTEPINSRIFRKADALPEERREQFKALRDRYAALAVQNFVFHPVVIDNLLSKAADGPPSLPLRPMATEAAFDQVIPADVLDATALRPLLEASVEHSLLAIAEFDAVFGERA